jgi:hypothetical protein
MKMQQTKSYWRLAALASAAGVALVFVGSACTVTTSTDAGGSAGETIAGAPGAGATQAGAGGAAAGAPAAGAPGAGAPAAGAGGAAPVPYNCTPASGEALGTPNTCEPAPGSETDVCALCVKAKCCKEYSECYATTPGNQCGWGGPMDKGEIVCAQQCIVDGIAESGVYDATLVGTCANKCTTQTANGSSKECGEVIGQQTNDLIACLGDNCQMECFGG